MPVENTSQPFPVVTRTSLPLPALLSRLKPVMSCSFTTSPDSASSSVSPSSCESRMRGVTAETSVVWVGSTRSSAETEEAAVASPAGDSEPPAAEAGADVGPDGSASAPHAVRAMAAAARVAEKVAVRVERRCGAKWDTGSLSREREDATDSQ